MPISPPLNTRRACIRQKLIQDLRALNAKPLEPETLNPEALNHGQYNPLYNPDMNPNLNSNIIPRINPSIILNISLYSPYISSPIDPYISSPIEPPNPVKLLRPDRHSGEAPRTACGGAGPSYAGGEGQGGPTCLALN